MQWGKLIILKAFILFLDIGLARMPSEEWHRDSYPASRDLSYRHEERDEDERDVTFFVAI